MSSAEGPASRQLVTALRRPPVRQSTLVRASARHTFDTFITTIGAWWPVQPFSAGKERVRDITIEQRQGGASTRSGTMAPRLTGARCSPGSPPSGSR